MGADKRNGAVSRRTFIRVAAGSAIVLPGLMAACSAPAPSAPAAQPTTGAAAPAKPASALPSYIPIEVGPKPDYVSAGPQYEHGWENYPTDRFKAWTKAPPGAGPASTINAFTNGFYPPSTPYDQNLAWQAVNKELNANVQFTVIPPSDYAAKLGTTMAGDDLPDLILFTGGLNVTLGQQGTANLPVFLQQKCADLTPYLAGDAVKDYPYLANIPTYAWQNSGSAFQGKLYMLPIQRYVAGQALFKNVGIYDADIGKDYLPKNAEDLKKVFIQLNRPQEGRYATASFQGRAFSIAYYAAMFGAPHNWKLDGGKLIKDFETPEFKAAVAYANDLFNAGVYHPKTLEFTDINAARLEFVAGRIALYPEGFGQPWADFARRGLRSNPPQTFYPLPPFPAADGGTPQHYLGPGFIAANALKKASPDRIREILRVMDFLASPFGSEEVLLINYGLPDIHYTLDAGGKLTLNERSNADANYVNWKYLMQHPQVMYSADIPGYAKAEYEAEHFLLPHGVNDPTWGLYSPTLGAKGPVINRAVIDELTGIIANRRPIAEYDQVIKDWRDNGGEQIRKELQDALAASGR
jgi:putative aldouronate transport system substrate-binding protein